MWFRGNGSGRKEGKERKRENKTAKHPHITARDRLNKRENSKVTEKGLQLRISGK